MYILCNFQRTSWKPRIIGIQQTKVCWWPSERKPPVPIPNTVVKTLSGENTWRATSWEDSSLPTSKLNKSEITWIGSFTFLFVWIYPLMDFNFRFFFIVKLNKQNIFPNVNFYKTSKLENILKIFNNLVVWYLYVVQRKVIYEKSYKKRTRNCWIISSWF